MAQPGRPPRDPSDRSAAAEPRPDPVDSSHVGGREDRGVGVDVFGRGGDYPGGGYGAEGYAAAYPDLKGDALLGDYGQDEQRARRRAADALDGAEVRTAPLSCDGQVVVGGEVDFKADAVLTPKPGKK